MDRRKAKKSGKVKRADSGGLFLIKINVWELGCADNSSFPVLGKE